MHRRPDLFLLVFLSITMLAAVTGLLPVARKIVIL